MKAKDIISTVETTLLDPENQFWQLPELLSYINDAQRQIVVHRPQANARAEIVSLQAGERQQLPALGALLLDVTRNANGPAITPVDRRDIDRMVPNWTQKTPASEVEHYMYDDRFPNVYAVYPPAEAGTEVEIIYSASLADVQSDTDDLALPEQYRAAIIDYVLYRAHSKSTQAAIPQRAQAYYQAFMQDIGMRAPTDQSVAAGEPDETNPRQLR